MKAYLPILCRDFFAENAPLSKKSHIIVAISGGLDSVVLTRLLQNLGVNITLAHVNFQLRGQESNRDEAFVTELAKTWRIPLQVRRVETETYAKENGQSIQVAARQLRYGFFEEIRKEMAQQGQQVWVATAHHANDSIETRLMNFFRGTGIDGLKGIPPKNGYIIRPLLKAKRLELEAYALENNLKWVEDSSNQKEDYTRNYLRHTIIPAIEKQYPAFINNMMVSGEFFVDAAAFYHEAVERRLKKLIEKERGMEKVSVLKVMKMAQAETLIYEWIRQYGFSQGQVREVLKLTVATNGSYVASATHRLIRNRNWLIMASLKTEVPEISIVASLPFSGYIQDGKPITIGEKETWNRVGEVPVLPATQAWLDAKHVSLPLIIRRWKQGDYFYPLGTGKKKKVARFLIDNKVSPLEKEHVFVLECQGKILWVIGYRIDDRFKITANTNSFIKIKTEISS